MRRTAVLILILGISVVCVSAQTNGFTYQSKLTDGGSPAGGTYDLLFKLYDAPGPPGPVGTQIGSDSVQDDITVSGGIFTVILDFGSTAFTDGGPRYVEIYVRPGTSTGTYTMLTPRQVLTSAPYAIKSKNADQLGGISANQYLLTTGDGSGLTNLNAGNITTGTLAIANGGTGSSTQNFVDLSTDQTTIGGNKTFTGIVSGNTLNSDTQYNINGVRVLSRAGTQNLFAGQGAGTANPGGSANVFVGFFAGNVSQSGNNNSFFGANAGGFSNLGDSNTFIGSFAGLNTLGVAASENTFVGAFSGSVNSTGRGNTLLGFGASTPNPGTLLNATAIGNRALVTQSNSLVLGSISGLNNCTPELFCADANVGIGTTAPTERLHVVGNGLFTGNLTFSGSLNGSGSALTNLNASNLASGTVPNTRLGVIPAANGGTGLNSPGTAGSFLKSGGSNWFSQPLLASELPPGNNNYIQNTAGFQSGAAFNIGGNGTAGGTLSGNIVNSNTNFQIANLRVLAFGSGTTSSILVGLNSGVGTSGGSNSFFGNSSGQNTTTGFANSFFGSQAGQNSNGSSNSFFGVNSGSQTSGSSNAFFGNGSGVSNTAGSNNTLIGSGANVGSNSLTYATAIGSDAVVSSSSRIVLGRSTHVDTVEVPGPLQVTLVNPTSSIAVCINNSQVLTLCSSSLRYKTNIARFSSGMALIRQLQPITFTWKKGGEKDVGFGAEDVARIEPLFTFRNDKGQIEGVKYDRMSVAFVNAFKEQQAQIEALQKQVDELKSLLRAKLNGRRTRRR